MVFNSSSRGSSFPLAEGRSNCNNCRLSPPQHWVHGGEGSQGGLNWLGRGQIVKGLGVGLDEASELGPEGWTG